MIRSSNIRCALGLLTVLTALSCSQHEQPAMTTAENIVFSPVEQAGTKALLDNDGLHTADNRIRVLDAVSGFSGSADWMGETPYYINEDIVYDGEPVWAFSSQRFYPWTADGSHRFFGWLAYDASLDLTAEDFFNEADLFDPANMVFSIPTLTMDTSTPVFDFLYTGLAPVEAAARSDSTPIDLPLQHLFTAMGLTIINTSGNAVLLKSVTLTGMKNIRSARIDFTGNAPVVTTDNISSSNVALFTSSEPGGDSYVSVDREEDLVPDILMWPQSYADLENARLVVEYNIRDQYGIVSDDLSATIDLNEQAIFKTHLTGMDAGTRYSFLLQFKKSTIDLYTRALPWEYEEYDWDYAEHSISARSGMFKDGVLAFYRGVGITASEPTTDEWSARTMRFQTRNEIMTGRFYIEAPTSGLWQVSAYPLSSADYFIITPTSGDINADVENGKAEFTVSVNPERIPNSTQTLYFNVSIFFNGEWHDANSEFNRKNIKLVLDAN